MDGVLIESLVMSSRERIGRRDIYRRDTYPVKYAYMVVVVARVRLPEAHSSRDIDPDEPANIKALFA